MTKDELIALRRERGKQELNIGDRVKVYDQNGNVMYGGKTAIIIEKALLDPTEFYYGLYVEGETVDKFRGKGLLYQKNTATKIGKTALLAPFYAEDLELVKQPTDEIKVGDRVKFKSKEELETMLEPSFWWGIPLLAEKEAEIINIPFEDEYIVDIDPSLGGIRREFFDKLPKKQPDNTITIPVKADFGEDVGFALLDRALELQKKYTELEGEIKRLYDLVNTAMCGNHIIVSQFDNDLLGSIANLIYAGFRPLTEEERKQRDAEFKIAINNLKKQSE